MTNIQHALILGGTGFIGASLVEQLLQEQIRVTCVIHRTPPLSRWNDRVGVLYSSLPHLPFDQLTGDRCPDVLFHFARISGRRKPGRVVSAWRSRLAHQRLLMWLRSLPRPPLLVLIAGTLAYGSRGDERVTEDTPLAPTGYARDYAWGEEPLVAALASELPVMIMRAPWVYGPGSWFQRFFWQPIIRERLVPVYGSGQQWMSCISARDCGRLIFYLARSGQPGQTYNLILGESVRHRQFGGELQRFFPDCPVRECSFFQVALRHGLAAAESLMFSLRVETKHQELYRKFVPNYPGLSQGLESVVQELRAL